MTPQELEDNGYTCYTSNTYKTIKNTDTLYQKRITNKIGIKYFIDLWYYENVWQPEAVFYDIDNNALFEVTLYDASYINIIEEKFEKIWSKMNCGYYERY